MSEDWSLFYMLRTKLKYLVKSITSGGTPISDDSRNYTDENGINWVAIGDMSTTPYIYKTQKQITDRGQKEKRLKIYPIGTILYSIYATVGRVAVLKIPATINQAILAIEPNEKKITRDYLKYSLIALEDDVLQDVSTNTQSNLNAEKVRNFKVSICSIEMQNEITHRLDEKIDVLDKLLGTLNFEIKDLQKYRTSKIREHLIEMSNGKIVRLQDVCSMRKGPFGSALKKEIFVPKSNNTYKIYEQQHAIDKDISLGEYYIDKSRYSELYSFKVNPGDIIISCAGTIGEVFILPENIENGIINQALMRVRTKNTITRDYFVLVWKYLILEDILISSNGSAIKNIPPFSYLNKIKLNLPDIDRQNDITTEISRIYNEIQDIINVKNTKIMDLLAYKKTIIREMVASVTEAE